MELKRRQWLSTACSVGTGVVLLGCQLQSQKDIDEEASEKAGKENAATEVNATEDLMREHGVLRRCLLVYEESIPKLRNTSVPPEALEKTAKLFQVFGEDYHEKKLEETHIFPAVTKAGGMAAAYIGVLNAQHQRGREITDYVLSVTAAAKLGGGSALELARVLEAFVRMYQHHAAIEDTIVFPAWKETMTKDQMDAISDKFEELEHEQFGKDGYEDAVKRVTEIETSLGLADLGQFTAPAPPLVRARKSQGKAAESSPAP